MTHVNSLNSTEFTKLMLGQDSPISLDTYVKTTDELSRIRGLKELISHTKEFVSQMGLSDYFLVPVSQGQVKCISQEGLESKLVNDYDLQQIVDKNTFDGVISQLQEEGEYQGKGLFGEKIVSANDFFAIHGVIHAMEDDLSQVSEKLQLVNRMINGKFRDNFNKLLDPKISIIFNGVYFDEMVEQSLTKAYAENQSVSVLLGDFCALKYCNDMFGHNIGDLMLKRSAELLLKVMPKNSIVSRFGSKSDEFGVLLYGISNIQAEEYRNNVEEALKEKNESRAFKFKSIEKETEGQTLTFPFYLPMGVVTVNPRQQPNLIRRDIYLQAEKQYLDLKSEFYKNNSELNLRSNSD